MADSVTYEYDLNGRLKNLTFANSDELNVQYDDMGNREEVEITIAPPLMLKQSQPPQSSALDAATPDAVQAEAFADEKNDSSSK